MEQALVFAATAGAGFYFFNQDFQSQINAGPDTVGLNTFRPQVPVTQYNYVPSKDKTNITHASDINPAWRDSQQRLIEESKFESRHRVLDPFRFHDEAQVGFPTTDEIPSLRSWTREHEIV